MSTDERRPIIFRWGAKADLATIAFLLPIIFIAAYFGDIEKGMTAACGGAVLVLLIRIVWHLHDRSWFWITISLMVVVHIFVAIYFPWARNNFSAFVLLPFGAVDFGLMYACIKLLEQWLD